jgi:hypothetical protein
MTADPILMRLRALADVYRIIAEYAYPPGSRARREHTAWSKHVEGVARRYEQLPAERRESAQVGSYGWETLIDVAELLAIADASEVEAVPELDGSG